VLNGRYFIKMVFNSIQQINDSTNQQINNAKKL